MKGTKVLLIDDTNGNTRVMKGFQLGLKPKKIGEQFLATGEAQFKKLPPGLKIRSRCSEEALGLMRLRLLNDALPARCL